MTRTAKRLSRNRTLIRVIVILLAAVIGFAAGVWYNQSQQQPDSVTVVHRVVPPICSCPDIPVGQPVADRCQC